MRSAINRPSIAGRGGRRRVKCGVKIAVEDVRGRIFRIGILQVRLVNDEMTAGGVEEQHGHDRHSTRRIVHVVDVDRHLIVACIGVVDLDDELPLVEFHNVFGGRGVDSLALRYSQAFAGGWIQRPQSGSSRAEKERVPMASRRPDVVLTAMGLQVDGVAMGVQVDGVKWMK